MSAIGTLQPITKQDFLAYFRYPKAFWFLLPDEVEDFFEDRSSEILEEGDLSFRDHMKLLRELVESPKSLLMDNAMKLNSLKDDKILNYYQKFFQLPNLSVYDHSSVHDDRTAKVLKILSDTSKNTIFLYKPTLICNGIKIKPTALYKYQGRLYLIEHFWSTALRRESLATFAFYNHFFTKHLHLKIDQYLITYLSKKPSPDKQLLVEITNCLPFTSQTRTPEGLDDQKMKNVNGFFGLNMAYENSIYRILFAKDEFDAINNEPWEVEDEELLNPQLAIDALMAYANAPDRSLNFQDAALSFLEGKVNLLGPSSAHYKSIFQHLLPSFTFSSSVMPLVNSLQILLGCKTPQQRNGFLDYVSDFSFLPGFPDDQDYILFPDAASTYNALRAKRTKVYYDFETVSFPFPFMENTKPYLQIVLQLSLIVTVDNVERTPTTNIILDPLSISVDCFKRIIDAIYVDDVDVAYVVYNKSFENTRLKEMAELINEESYRRKVVEIIDRTVDLANWFTYGNSPRIIHRKLQGFHSIKKVNKLIPEDIERLTGIKRYSDLKKCQNGVMAQAMLLSRALVTDPENDKHNWNKNKEFMYSYCENDVRSMIAVELYIGKLIEDNRYPVFDPEGFKKNKLRFKRIKGFSRG